MWRCGWGRWEASQGSATARLHALLERVLLQTKRLPA